MKRPHCPHRTLLTTTTTSSRLKTGTGL
ncbi:hypothetical protein WG66_009489 [Moniliophthora roreri]|nr:hypothetical protein WG66_009490 [Moniliophthora roreri]KAI3618813.1 hypothetical protein WG66_009489 [Moniliophthora roreri]